MKTPPPCAGFALAPFGCCLLMAVEDGVSDTVTQRPERGDQRFPRFPQTSSRTTRSTLESKMRCTLSSWCFPVKVVLLSDAVL